MVDIWRKLTAKKFIYSVSQTHKHLKLGIVTVIRTSKIRNNDLKLPINCKSVNL